MVTVAFDIAAGEQVYPLLSVVERMATVTDGDNKDALRTHGSTVGFAGASIAKGRVTVKLLARTYHAREAIRHAEAWVRALADTHEDRNQIKLCSVVVG